MKLSRSNIKKFFIFSYNSESGNPERFHYILGNGTFSYFRKR